MFVSTVTVCRLAGFQTDQTSVAAAHPSLTDFPVFRDRDLTVLAIPDSSVSKGQDARFLDSSVSKGQDARFLEV